MLRKTIDYSLYLVTDQGLCRHRDLLDVVREAIDGGVSVVQLREKHLAARDFIHLARRVKELLRPRGIPFFINDRVDIALAVGADGVHVGQEDMPVPDVRALVGEDMAVGLTVNNEQDIRKANKLPVDYLGVGPIFSTSTKADAKEPIGLNGLGRLRALTGHTLVAIGAVKAESAFKVIRAGADGLAVVSAICEADDPRASAEELRRRIAQARDSYSSGSS